jgi:tricorn protease-like protein
MTLWKISAAPFGMAVALALAAATLAGAAVKTTRVSVNSGAEGNNESLTNTDSTATSTVSANGRFFAFESVATNLVAGDHNNFRDIFVRDRRTGRTTRVSVSSAGKQTNGDSFAPTMSANGRYVAFESTATKLVKGDNNHSFDAFVYDRKTHKTSRVSVDSKGKQGNQDSSNPSISADGRFVAFDSKASNLAPGDTLDHYDVFVRDRKLGETQRVSVSSAGKQGNRDSFYPSISAGGRFVSFTSEARTLVGGDTNGVEDVFVRDRKAGTTKRVSVSSAGAQGDMLSHTSSISANGRFVAFESEATNLVANDTLGFRDVFVRDRKAGKTKLVSVGLGGVEADSLSFHPSISASGRFVAFESVATNLVANDLNGDDDVFVRDRKSGETERASLSSDGTEGGLPSGAPSISAGGRFVAFQSVAANLVGDDGNFTSDAFARDRKSGQTERVSVSTAGAEGDANSSLPSVSANGRFVAFYSFAENLVEGDDNQAADIFVRDRKRSRTERVNLGAGGTQAEDSADSADPSISADGRFVAFDSKASNLAPGDTLGYYDVFVRNRKAGKTQGVSVSSAGAEGDSDSFDPVISANGRFVVFQSGADNLVADDSNTRYDIFVRDRKKGQTTRVSVSSAGEQADANSAGSAISANGRFVAFGSNAANLVPNDGNHTYDVFVRDRKTGKTRRVSVSSDGEEGNGASQSPSISANGRFVAFSSGAANLVPGDSLGHVDVFVHDRKTGKTKRVNLSSAGAEANLDSDLPSISAGGRFVAFESFAKNLVHGDTKDVRDVFVRDRKTGKTKRVSVSSAGVEGDAESFAPSISANGRFVAFESPAMNLVPEDLNNARDVFIRGPLH